MDITFIPQNQESIKGDNAISRKTTLFNIGHGDSIS